jgi:hypothetical protein
VVHQLPLVDGTVPVHDDGVLMGGGGYVLCVHVCTSMYAMCVGTYAP